MDISDLHEQDDQAEDNFIIAGSEAEYVAQLKALGDPEEMKRLWG
ncbi:MAG: hypothetical protein ABR571_08400 [Jatrophihabitans sp.]